jgi:hypothetical protein
MRRLTSAETRATLRIYRASLETVNYEFEAYGSTAHHARAALRNAIRRHCVQCNFPLDTFTLNHEDAMVTREVVLGGAYRDGEPL